MGTGEAATGRQPGLAEAQADSLQLTSIFKIRTRAQSGQPASQGGPEIPRLQPSLVLVHPHCFASEETEAQRWDLVGHGDPWPK